MLFDSCAIERKKMVFLSSIGHATKLDFRYLGDGSTKRYEQNSKMLLSFDLLHISESGSSDVTQSKNWTFLQAEIMLLLV